MVVATPTSLDVVPEFEKLSVPWERKKRVMRFGAKSYAETPGVAVSFICAHRLEGSYPCRAVGDLVFIANHKNGPD